MKFAWITLLLIHSSLLLFSQADNTQYVDPFIGTGGHGHTYPGATLPFGMVQLSPDTRDDGSWDGCGGYHYSDSLMFGFSHTHLSGTGCSDYGDILLLPAIDSVDVKKKTSALFHHANEKASAGYYSVKLDNGITAELSATTRVGIHKYIFPKGSKPSVVLDLMHRDKVIDASLHVVNKNTLEGYRRSQAWAKNQVVYFRIEFSAPFKIRGSKMDSLDMGDGSKIKELKGNIRSWLRFDLKPGEPLLIKVAISGVSEEGARKNMESELSHWDFERVKKEAHDAWQKELSKIDVSGGTEEQTKVFYTALYHCFIQPNIYNDVDGQYRGRDLKVHKAEGFNYYTVFSLWDTFRAWHPLMTIIDRKRSLDFIKTFLAQYEQGGLLPVWELSSNETECMIGYHSASVIADAAMKGITDFNMEEAFEAMKKSAESRDRYGLGAYIDKGCLSVEDENESVSKTLEYAYDDWCIAQMAQLLNHEKDFLYFMERSQSWKNLFDRGTGFIRPRKNGGWLEPFDPYEVNNNFTEANAWQYTFFVPQDIFTLIEMSGGEKKFEKKLDELFTVTSQTTGREQSDLTGMVGQYAQGNEPSHHMAFLYNYVDNPFKTHRRVRMLLDAFYHATPDGLIGNEDCGQMSAWYVMSSIGLYQLCPGEGMFTTTIPLFKQIRISLEDGNVLSIKNEATHLIETQSAAAYMDNELEGSEYISYDKLIHSKEIVFRADLSKHSDHVVILLSDAEQTNVVVPEDIIPVPLITSNASSFKEELKITIKSLQNHLKIYYTLDGSTPNLQSSIFNFQSPITIHSSCTVEAVAANENGEMSKVSTAHFSKAPHPDYKVNLLTKYSSQYSAGGNEGIIDGIHGDANWRKGNWQGYQNDFECVIDLGQEQEIKKISGNFLQDVGAWILMPKQVEFSFSSDGKTFSKPVLIKNSVPDNDLIVQTKNFSETLPSRKAKFVKIKAINYGKLPSWHAGASGQAWIFVDEISIE